MPSNDEHLELKLKKRVQAAQRTGRLDLASTPNCRFRFKKVPSQVYGAFGDGGAAATAGAARAKAGGASDKKKRKDDASAASAAARRCSTPRALAVLQLALHTTREIYSLGSLETLCLSSNHISNMPTTIGDLPLLRRLLLDGNKITSVPPDIARLRYIEEIRLDGNRLSEFPLVLTELSTLKRLGLSRNKIGPSIPSQVRKLRNLIELDLDHNAIERLPRGISFLHRTLQQLGLAFNRFNELPAVVHELAVLDVLRLEGNRCHAAVDEETGEEHMVYDIPVRHDGFLELRTGEHILKEDGSEDHTVHKLPGYLEESFVYNRMNAEWLRDRAGAEVHEVELLKARARARRKSWRRRAAPPRRTNRQPWPLPRASSRRKW